MLNPRLYREYQPAPNRTLTMRRTWRERVLDLRHATGLMISELSELSNILHDTLYYLERPRGTVRPSVPTILSIRRMEAVFKEELVRYLMKPHGLLCWRESRRRKLLPFGGYSASLPCPGVIRSRTTVTFGDRTFSDIAAMGNIEDIRALKNVKTGYDFTGAERYIPPRRGVYDGIISAASRGHFMPVAEIARIVEDHHEV